MFSRKGPGRAFLLLLPLAFWGLSRPLPKVHPLLKVGERSYRPGEEVLLLEGVPYPVKVELQGGVKALGGDPSRFKKGTFRVFMNPDGFGVRGFWGEGGCFVVKRQVVWKGPFIPYPRGDDDYVLTVPWYTRAPLEVEVDKEWLCDVRGSSGTKIERVKERGKGRFTLRVLEAREAWYKSLYVTAWGTEDGELKSILDHMVFLMGLLEHQILEGEEGMVRLNLLAWRDAMEDLKERLGVMASRGEPVGVWVRLLPSWRAWPRIEAGEKDLIYLQGCWEKGLGLLGLKDEGPMASYPFPLFPERDKGEGKISSSGVLSLVSFASSCWDRWRDKVDSLAFPRAAAVETDGEMMGALGKGGTWQVGWVPWQLRVKSER